MRLQEMLEWSARVAGLDTVPVDSMVYVEAEHDLRRVLFGVDIGIDELLVARELGFDAVIAHHPVGDRAVVDMPIVVRRQVEQMVAEGVEREQAEQAVAERLDAPHRSMHPANINRVVDSARLLRIPLANIHLPCDVLSRQIIHDCIESHAGEGSTVADAISGLHDIPEIAHGLTQPEVWLGDEQSPLGRFTVAIAGGFNGGYPAFSRYFRAGVGTVFTMHLGEPDLVRLRDDPGSAGHAVVVTGHMASDSIGINRVIAGLEAQGVEVVRVSGVVAP